MATAAPARTHCPHGHEFTEENTYVHRGWRWCRTCRVESARKRRERLAAALAPGVVLDSRTHGTCGHEFTEENTYVYLGAKFCRTCRAANLRRSRERRAALAPGVVLDSRTHCTHGHEFTEANTYVYQGRKLCRTCRAANLRRLRQRHRDEPTQQLKRHRDEPTQQLGSQLRRLAALVKEHCEWERVRESIEREHRAAQERQRALLIDYQRASEAQQAERLAERRAVEELRERERERQLERERERREQRKLRRQARKEALV